LLNQQVSGDIADALIEGDAQAVEERFVAILFLDIRSFTPKVAQWQPEAINAYQNEVFGFMIDIIEAHHGNINQLLGDGFMATFGAPKSAGNDVQHAVDAGLEILNRLETMNTQGSIPETQIGIGIDCGHAVMGNVGNATRKQFSITGNVVISAARIEQSNKTFNSSMMISKAAKNRTNIADDLVVHTTTLKGQSQETTLYQVR
jgi:adenylate cyclase